MSMNGKAQISVQANLSSGTTSRLQSELNAIAKKLTLNIGKLKMQNQQFNKSIQEGIRKSEQTIAKETKKQITQNDEWYRESAIKRWKLSEQTEQKNYKMKQAEIKNIQKVTDMEEKQLQYIQKVRKGLEKQELANNKLAEKAKIDTESFKTTKFARLDKMQIGAETIFTDPKVKQGLESLKNSINSFGAEGGKNIKQINSEMSKFETTVKKVGYAKKQLNKETNSYFKNLGMILKKFSDWMIVSTIIFAPLRAFQSGLQTLKEIDTQLVDIAKVTNMSKEEMKDLANEAAKVGIELGRTTQEYLQAVTEFSRAGYGETAKDLAKLSLLLQNVGDVSSDTANEMLLAVDAAYNLGGNAQELTKIIDSLNMISNNNPTTVGKMADGIKVAASVFKLAGLSINEFTALVGTATSTTQMSGDVIARGMRTVLLNLQGVTDEVGETTEETISKSEKVLKRYGIAVRNSVEEFRNPMEVLAEISEKFQSTLLDNQVAQSEIITTLAGKRQANILASIVDNWDMVQKQQFEAMYSMGSAMRENEIYMDSWEAKSKQLSASVSQFWQETLNTDLVKGFIDGIRGIIEWLTKMGGLVPIVFGLLAGAITSGVIAFKALEFALLKLNIQLGVMNALTGGLPILIGAAVTVITALGYKYIWAKDSVEKFNTALSTNLEKEKDLLIAEDERIRTLDKMVSRYEELTTNTNKTKEEMTELETITNSLNSIYPELNVGVTDLNDSYDIQIGKLKDLTSIERQRFTEKVKNAKIEADMVLEQAKSSKDSAYNKYTSAISTRDALNKTLQFIDSGEDIGMLKGGMNTKEYFEKHSDKFTKGTGITDDAILSHRVFMAGTERSIKNWVEKARDEARDVAIASQEEYNKTLEAESTLRTISPILSDLETGEYWTKLEAQAAADEEERKKKAKEAAELLRIQREKERQQEDKDNAKYVSPIESKIREITLQSQQNKEIEDSIKKEIERANKAEDYTKAIELQNKLLSHQENSISNIKLSQKQLSAEEDKVRETTDYDTTKWFLSTGGTNTFYNDLFNSLGESGQTAIEDVKNKLQTLGDAWRSQQELVEDYTDGIINSKDAILDLEKTLIQYIKETHAEQVASLEKGELKIQEIIKKGIDMRKDAMKEELDDYKKLIDDKISKREEEWEKEDLAKQKDKEVKNITELQKKISALARTNTLSGIAKRKELEKELADELEKIQDADTKRRREIEKKAMEDSLKFKEESVDDNIKALNEEWNHEKITLKASEIMRKQSFSSLKSDFPELFATLKVSSDNFFGVFEAYEVQVVGSTTSMKTSIIELLAELQKAINASDRLYQEQDRLINQQKKLDSAKVAIGMAQTRFKELESQGFTMETNSEMRDLHSNAQRLRDENGLEFENYAGYKGSFSQGINAGAVTSTGAYMLHGSPSNPEWVLTNNQMLGMIKNLVKSPSPQFGGGSNGVNLSIMVNGDADKGTVEKIKEAGKDILAEFRNNFKKYSMV